MADPAPAPTDDLRGLRRRLAEAQPEKLGQVLRLLEHLPRDPQTDAMMDSLLSPLRPTLRRLRPDRRLTLMRLLFVPLDPLVVGARGWQRGSASIPRTAIPPLAEAVRLWLGPRAAAITADFGQAMVSDLPRLAEPAEQFWIEAARLFAGPDLDAAIATAAHATPGLTGADLAALARAIAPILGFGRRLTNPLDQTLPGALLSAAATVPPADLAVAWEMALALLLERMEDRAAVLLIARQMATQPVQHRALEAAPAMVLTRLEARLGDVRAAVLGDAAAELERAASLLEALRDGGAAARRIAPTLSGQFVAAGRARLASALADDVLRPLTAITTADAAHLVPLEARLREVRRLDAAGRALGGGGAHEAALAATADAIAGRADLPEIGRARLVELLVGAQAAVRRFPALA